MKKYAIISLTFLLTIGIFSQSDDDLQFHKGIAYYLLEDLDLAKKHLNLYFYNKSNFQLKNGFMLLLEKKYWDATTQFEEYLGLNHRSEIALVGIALSTVDMKNTATVENLERVIRLNPRFPSPYLCLGVEFIKKKNYPVAEGYLKSAMKFGNIPEFKIILANLYLDLGEPKLALDLMLGEAEKNPDNFYYNFLTAKTYLKLNDLNSMEKYIDSALEIKPKSQEANLLKAKYFLGKKEYIEAKSILASLKFDSFNEDYVKTFAHTLLELKDRKAVNYLYEFFSHKRWDRDINRLMGLYFLNGGKEQKIQNWIFRSILSGNEIDTLSAQFSAKFQFPQFLNLSFFEVKKIRWLSEGIFLAIARIKAGDAERIYFIDGEKMKILNSFAYRGDFQDIFISKDLKNIVLSDMASANDSVYLYAIQVEKNKFYFTPFSDRPFRMVGVHVGFNREGSVAYFTDSSISSLAFESPFSSVSLYGQKRLIYPVYPQPVYKYDFSQKRFMQMKDINQIDQLEKIPIEETKKYALVSRAFQSNSKINDLIHRGEKLDLTSSQVIKIHFADDLSGFIVYLSDLNNAFQALVYDVARERVNQVDESMFLGKNRYAEIEILSFLPEKQQIIIKTKDKLRDIIEFNYHSYLYSFLSKDIIDFCFNPQEMVMVILSERSNNMFYNDTNLELVSFSPFSKNVVYSRRDLNQIVCCKDLNQIYFTTYDGEFIEMDDQHNFHYKGISFQGALHDISPKGEKAAVFVNGRIFVLDWLK